MSESTWTLHAQLAADTTAVGELALSRVLAVNAADYPWLILVPPAPAPPRWPTSAPTPFR